jgi:hypothetical protein
MATKLSILCVHGVGHGDADAALAPAWTDAISTNLRRWSPALELDFDFLRYDDLFDHAPLNGKVYAAALARLLASGLVHGLGDLFPSTRGLFDVPDQIRWTAGMIAQWASEDALRAALRQRVLKKLQERAFTVICAHSLGSLVCYDTLRRNPGGLGGKTLITFGSQIGNPFVRDCFAGRIEPLKVRQWYHLFNPDDHVLTAHLRISAPNFAEVQTAFDKPGDILNHDPVYYFNHTNTQGRVWPDVAGGAASRSVTRGFERLRTAARRPRQRALLVGINDYPNPANRLEGCVNDVFLMSGVLQDCGFRAEDIRVVLNDRATASSLIERFHWLLDDVPEEAERVLFYSGHGAQIPSYGATGEVDHLDECLVPYDFDWSLEHAVRDKQFLEFYSQLPYDTRFVAIFDCCHSGGMTREGGLRPRGLTPPDDIRHRGLVWKAERWQARDLSALNASLSADFAGASGTAYRLGRGVTLRQLANRRYDAERKALDHKGAYLPVILEACGEQELSYEYREGTASYGAFTFAMAHALREARIKAGINPTFRTLAALTKARLRALGYAQQTPALVGPGRVLGQRIPWR